MVIRMLLLFALLVAPVFYHFEVQRGGNWSTQHIKDAISRTFVRTSEVLDYNRK